MKFSHLKSPRALVLFLSITLMFPASIFAQTSESKLGWMFSHSAKKMSDNDFKQQVALHRATGTRFYKSLEDARNKQELSADEMIISGTDNLYIVTPDSKTGNNIGVHTQIFATPSGNMRYNLEIAHENFEPFKKPVRRSVFIPNKNAEQSYTAIVNAHDSALKTAQDQMKPTQASNITHSVQSVLNLFLPSANASVGGLSITFYVIAAVAAVAMIGVVFSKTISAQGRVDGLVYGALVAVIAVILGAHANSAQVLEDEE